MRIAHHGSLSVKTTMRSWRIDLKGSIKSKHACFFLVHNTIRPPHITRTIPMLSCSRETTRSNNKVFKEILLTLFHFEFPYTYHSLLYSMWHHLFVLRPWSPHHYMVPRETSILAEKGLIFETHETKTFGPLCNSKNSGWEFAMVQQYAQLWDLSCYCMFSPTETTWWATNQ